MNISKIISVVKQVATAHWSIIVTMWNAATDLITKLYSVKEKHMRGTLKDMIKPVQVLPPNRYNGAATYYNGQSITTNAGIGVDTQDFDDIDWVVNIGAVQGTDLKVINSIYESDNDDPTTAVLLEGAVFTPIMPAVGKSSQEAHIVCSNHKRFQFLKTELQGTGAFTADLSAVAILGLCNQPPAKTLVFSL